MFLPSNMTLKFGDSGDFVSELQRRLAMVKCFSEDQVNGFYDGPTVNGVTQFQGMHGLTADGVAGPETLRRLNGVIAGDTSGAPADDKKEEQTQAYQQQSQVYDYMQQQQQETLPQWTPVTAEASPAAAVHEAPAAYAPPPPPEPVQAASAQPSALEMLLRAEQMQQQAQPLLPEANLPPAQQHQPIPQAQQPSPLDLLQQAAQQQQPAPLPPAASAEPKPEQEQAAPATAAAQPQPGMLRRFANAVMQKMADYFEAKLPPSVLSEVQQIGMVMAQAGLKEAPVPTGPEMGQRQPELPGRDQQPAQQRG